MKRKIIAFMGNGPTAGKTTAAKIIFEKSKWPRIISFAASVKEIAYDLGWDGEKDERGRRLLEDIGMGARLYNPDVWVDKWQEKVNGWDDTVTILTDDCRMANEVARIKNLGGILVKIQRDGCERPDLRAEQYMPGDSVFDYIIENNGTIEDLEKALEVIPND